MALTGWSITGAPEQGQVDKEEFLGDAVLGLAISELLMLYHPSESVGVLSASKASLVSGKSLARKAQSLGLAELLKSRGAPLPARMQDVLADVLESLIGAVYLDQGYQAVRDLIERLYRDDFTSVVLGWEQRDLKGMLQEIVVRETGEMPDYQTRPGEGKAFVAEVYVLGRLVGQGRGGTKKEAEAHAAENALLGLNEWLKEFVQGAEQVRPSDTVSQPGDTPEIPTPLPAIAEQSAGTTESTDGADQQEWGNMPHASVREPIAKTLRKRRTRRAGRRVQARRQRKRESGDGMPQEGHQIADGAPRNRNQMHLHQRLTPSR